MTVVTRGVYPHHSGGVCLCVHRFGESGLGVRSTVVAKLGRLACTGHVKYFQGVGVTAGLRQRRVLQATLFCRHPGRHHGGGENV